MALILGVIGAAQLPVAAIGVVLFIVGFGAILAAMRLPAAGVLGVAALIVGGLLLFDTDSDQIAISPAFVIVAGAGLGLATIVVGDRAKIESDIDKLNLGTVEHWTVDATRATN